MSEKVNENTEKSDDKKVIEMEEREKMLNAENEAQNVVENKSEINAESGEAVSVKESVEEKKKSDIKEGMEVKPKKIPIGGIQMPGFFMRSKSKEKCKDDDQEVDNTELIQQSKETNEESQTLPARIKLPNPFRKSKLANESEDGERTTETEPNKEPKRLLDTIRLPLVSVFPRKKKESTGGGPTAPNLENQTAQAGLASMETLDDKSTDGKSNDELKIVPLNEPKGDLESQDGEVNVSWGEFFHAHRVVIGAMVLFLLVLVVLLALTIPILVGGRSVLKEAPVRNGKYVETITSCGRIEGMVEDSAIAFRGIPYARPPLGELRFKFAQPLNDIKYCWNGTFLAHNATQDCLQIHSNGTISGTEDCLTLDVVTPYVRYDNPLPVIVLIGAESMIGGSPGKMRPSARYARSKDVVFVRPNFRVGALGFLALKTLAESDYPLSSGNYGLSDILQALTWVQLNIEHFGGDKTSVTLLGHQTGATLVTALATISNAPKYFAKAWATSGGAIYPNKPLQEAFVDNDSFMRIVDCADAQCLRDKDAVQLVSAVEDTWRKPQPDLPSKNEEPDKRHQWLVLDGRILKEHPAEVWANGELKVQLVLGSTAHAGASQKLLLKHKHWTADLVKQHVNESFLSSKNLTEQALALYPHTYKGLSQMITDIRTVCPLFAIKTQMHKVPFYVVTQTRHPLDLADIDSDIDAILGRYEPKTAEQRRYFSAIQGLFYHYVWHGKVEHEEAFTQKVLVVGQDVLSNTTYSHCAFWINNNVVLSYAAID